MSGLHEFGTVINIIGGILMSYGYLPHLYSLIKTKKVGNNSKQYWIIMTFGIFCIGVNQFINHVPTVQLVSQCFNVGLAFICTIVLMYYSAKERRAAHA